MCFAGWIVCVRVGCSKGEAMNGHSGWMMLYCSNSMIWRQARTGRGELSSSLLLPAFQIINDASYRAVLYVGRQLRNSQKLPNERGALSTRCRYFLPFFCFRLLSFAFFLSFSTLLILSLSWGCIKGYGTEGANVRPAQRTSSHSPTLAFH